jgi:hypothetical protein
MSKYIYSLVLLVALSLSAPVSIWAQMPQSETENMSTQDEVTIIGELSVIEKDQDGNPLVIEIRESSDSSQDDDSGQRSTEDQSQLGQSHNYRIAREGKGMELFHMSSGGKVKITGTIRNEGNQRTLLVKDYVLMSAGLDSQQPQSEDSSSIQSPNESSTNPSESSTNESEDSSNSPRPDESSNDTVRPNESSDEVPDDDASEDKENIEPEQPRENLQEKQPQESIQQGSFFGSEYSFQQRELYRQSLERKLDEWEEKCSQAEKSHEEKIDQLEETQGKIDEAKNEAFQAKLDYCENLTESIRQNLDKVSSQTESGWQAFQKGVNDQLRELELAFSEMEAACKENFSYDQGIPQSEEPVSSEDSGDSEESSSDSSSDSPSESSSE